MLITEDKAIPKKIKKDIGHGYITSFLKSPKGIEKYSTNDENFQYVKKLQKINYIPKSDIEAEISMKEELRIFIEEHADFM